MADEDFSLRAKRKGFQLLISPRAIVYSHIHDTGIKEKKINGMHYFKEKFTSIKSPENLVIRWRWAKKHSKHPFIYYIMDITRVLLG